MITTLPELKTQRLLLRPFRYDDAPVVEQLAGAREIAATTCSIPHPYPAGAAALWISTHAGACLEGTGATLAITLKKTGVLIGAIGLDINLKHGWAEIGYWIGLPYWGHGYATEALRTLVPWAFASFPLNRLQACHFTRNPASGRVMQKAGLTLEGILRQRMKKWGQFEDVAVYAILRHECTGRP